MEQVTISVSPSGDVAVSVACVRGRKCQDITKDIEKALGRTVKDMPTSEMTEKAHVKANR